MSELLDNRAQRVRTLRSIVVRLHEGADPEAVRGQLREIVRECDATEIAQMEQELIADGVPVAQIMGMCDLHASVVREILVDRPVPLLTPGHPVTTFRRENDAIKQQTRKLREALGALAASPSAETLGQCQALRNELMDIDKHYLRKEHLLFSVLERHGITGPSEVMWAKDDEVRGLMASLGECLSRAGASPAELALIGPTVGAAALEAVDEMVFKEERILLPMALQTLSEFEWGEIWEQSPQFGWCLVDPDPRYLRPRPTPAPTGRDGAEPGAVPLSILAPASAGAAPAAGSLLFPTGMLTLDQLKLIFSSLPVDLTFVDADDRVRFFSEGPERVFVRPKAVIGRQVQHCHPPGSVHIVERILGDFRAGRQSVAEFWIELHKPRTRFVHIRYFALRDEAGVYAGTLEVTQDITRERSLTGERRLLHYDAPATETMP
jgi:DUF438 domain-containing protein